MTVIDLADRAADRRYRDLFPAHVCDPLCRPPLHMAAFDVPEGYDLRTAVEALAAHLAESGIELRGVPLRVQVDGDATSDAAAVRYLAPLVAHADPGYVARGGVYQPFAAASAERRT